MIGTEPRHRWVAVLATIVTAAVLSTAYASPKKKAVEEEALSRAFAFETALTGVAEAVSPSVVSIQVEVTRPQQTGFPMPFFGMPDRGGIVRGGGSGVILRSDGHILTNNHVVREATRIDVTLQNGKRYQARLMGADPASDLAVLKIDATGLKQAEFASSEAARVGQFVMAIGSPFGLDYTVTTGVLSAKGRGASGPTRSRTIYRPTRASTPATRAAPSSTSTGTYSGSIR